LRITHVYEFVDERGRAQNLGGSALIAILALFISLSGGSFASYTIGIFGVAFAALLAALSFRAFELDLRGGMLTMHGYLRRSSIPLEMIDTVEIGPQFRGLRQGLGIKVGLRDGRWTNTTVRSGVVV